MREIGSSTSTTSSERKFYLFSGSIYFDVKSRVFDFCVEIFGIISSPFLILFLLFLDN